VYTAFLFGQCEARDLWQNPLLGVSLIAQMVVAGAATLLLASSLVPTTRGDAANLALTLVVALGAHVLLVFLGEVASHHGSSNASAAAAMMLRGKYALVFWSAAVLGAVAPALALLLVPNADYVTPAAAGAALLGLWLYEHAFVMAGQAVPIS
jgi:Ni/Fe-hydrogenase subunit HybB-like protein